MANVNIMRFHTIHVPANLAGQERHLGHQVVGLMPVKEGFCWPAFFFSVFWAIWHKMWLVAAGVVLVNLVAHFLIVLAGASQIVSLLVGFGIAILLGYLANDIRRAKMKRNGYFERDVVIAPDIDSAVRRYVKARYRGR